MFWVIARVRTPASSALECPFHKRPPGRFQLIGLPDAGSPETQRGVAVTRWRPEARSLTRRAGDRPGPRPGRRWREVSSERTIARHHPGESTSRALVERAPRLVC